MTQKVFSQIVDPPGGSEVARHAAGGGVISATVEDKCGLSNGY